MMRSTTFLLECLLRAGMRDVVMVEPVTGGVAAFAGMATRRNAPSVFVKAFADTPADDVFVAEAEGLAALRELGGVATPEVILADRELLVLSVLRPRPRTETFWEQFAHALAHLHTTTTHPRFGWHRDNRLGRRRQTNTWDDDGFAFFAQHRLLRWLGQPRVEAALDAGGRAALERLCHRLPDLLPDRPACLTHGDLWAQNVLATPDGQPALIDPAVSYQASGWKPRAQSICAAAEGWASRSTRRAGATAAPAARSTPSVAIVARVGQGTVMVTTSTPDIIARRASRETMTVMPVAMLSAAMATSEDSHRIIRRIWPGVAPSSRAATNSRRRRRLPMSRVFTIAIPA